MPSIFSGHQRRQARPVHRAAADQHSCGPGINARPLPPHPPIEGVPPIRGKAWKEGGRRDSFSSSGRQGQPLKPVDGCICNYVPSGSTKRRARFAINQFPRFARFLPRFGLYRPRLGFSRSARLSLSFLFFLEREEGKEGGKAENTRSTIHQKGEKVYPRKFRVSTGFLWMPDQAAAQCWRGFQPFCEAFHGSTGGNALGSAGTAGQEVRHGH